MLYGDVPLTRASTLQRLVDAAREGRYGILTVTLDDPTGYGRIVRDAAGFVTRIVEQKDASPEQLKIAEINTGIIVTPTAQLSMWLGALKNENAQGEYYLTDVVELAIEAGFEVVTAQPDEEWETLGVNSKAQLAGSNASTSATSPTHCSSRASRSPIRRASTCAARAAAAATCRST